MSPSQDGRPQILAAKVTMVRKKKSVLTSDWEFCYLCGQQAECTHHVFGGSRRRTSTAEGFQVPLCNRCHNMSDNSVHFNRALELDLKQRCQAAYEKKHTREEFIKLIGRNYLE